MSKVMKFLMIYPCSLNFKTLSCHNVGIEFFYIRGDLNVVLPSPLELNLLGGRHYWHSNFGMLYHEMFCSFTTIP